MSPDLRRESPEGQRSEDGAGNPATTQPDRPRRRLGLSLRALMVLVLVAGGVMGWKARRADRQRWAVAAIRAGGGAVGYDFIDYFGDRGTYNPNAQPWEPAWLRKAIGDEYFQEAQVVWLTNSGGDTPLAKPGAADDLIARLADLDHLEMVQSMRVPISDAGLFHLARLTGLRGVELLRVPVTDEGLAQLGELRKLSGLNVVIDRKAGGHVTGTCLRSLAGSASLKTINLIGAEINDPALFAPLGQMRNLEALVISGSPNDGACLAHLAGLERLRMLSLDRTRVGDADLANLYGMAGLEHLDLEGKDVTDEGLARLARLRSMKSLDLHLAPRVTDAGLEHLAGLTRLQSLGLTGTKVTDAGLEYLANMPALERLDLSRSRITDDGVETLARSSRWKSINLKGTRITDAGLAHLRGLPDLEYLDVSDTLVSEEAVEALKPTLPRLIQANHRHAAARSSGK